MFDAIKRRIRNIEAASIANMLQALFSDPGIAGLVLDLNTGGQLFAGIDAKNKELSSIGGAYAAYTVRLKRAKGQVADHVTLKDTGDFYRSFDLIASHDSITITADSEKGGVDLQLRWGSELLGLTDASKLELFENLIPEVRKMILEKIHGK
jgi:hypothetical protein